MFGPLTVHWALLGWQAYQCHGNDGYMAYSNGCMTETWKHQGSALCGSLLLKTNLNCLIERGLGLRLL